MSFEKGKSNLKGSQLSKIGRVLVEDFLKPRRISLIRFAKDCRIPVADIYDLVEGRKPMDHFTADRLARALGTTHHFWMMLDPESTQPDWTEMDQITDPQIFGADRTTLITNGFDEMTTDVGQR